MSAPEGPSSGTDVTQVLERLECQWPETVTALHDLVRIASVSADGFPTAPLAESAHAVAALLLEGGMQTAEVVEHPDTPPAVIAEWRGAADAPTVLIYGHHDVQPPGEIDRWLSDPWQPVERDGRLYGRGVVDDKAGVISHWAAIRAWLSATGSLPVNVVMLIEGEEEVGSPHLESLLLAHKERLAADCLVLTDTCNLDTGIPALTVTLRGLVMADLEVALLDGPLHSGIWGGPLPDPVQGLARILARLSDDAGRVAIPGIARPPLTGDPYGFDQLPFDADHFCEQGGMLPQTRLLTEGAGATYRAAWIEPAVTVSALEAAPLATASNQILPRAAARIGVRLAPGQDAETCLEALLVELRRSPPWGCRVTVTPHCAAGGWQTDPTGPWFDAARRALSAGYGAQAVHIGCGGSIPFVEPFANAMGGIPALLLGVEDPPCRAHGENESLDLGDFYKSCRAAVHLLAEMATCFQQVETTP